MLLNLLTNWYNCTFRFPADQRAIMYEIMETQLTAGMPLQSVFSLLITKIKVSNEISAVATAGYQAIQEGRSGAEGLRDSNMIPKIDSYLLIAAEETGAWVTMLRQLKDAAINQDTFLSQVVVPNSYYLVLTGFLVFLVTQVERVAVNLGDHIALAGNPLYLLSVQLNDYLFVFGLVAGVFIVACWYISCHTYHSIRRLLPYFPQMAQLQYGMQFCGVSAMFYSIQGTHGSVLTAASYIYRDCGFMRGALRDLKVRYEGEGERYTESLGVTVLPKGIAAVLTAMLPDDNRDTASEAFRSAERLQHGLLRKQHQRARLIVQCTLMFVIGYLMLGLAEGIYGIYDLPT